MIVFGALPSSSAPALAPTPTNPVIEEIEARWLREGDASAPFTTEVSVRNAGRGHFKKDIEGAVGVLEGKGWRVERRSRRPNVEQWILTPSAAAIAERQRKNTARHQAALDALADVRLPLPIGAPDPRLLKLKHTVWARVGSERWIFEANRVTYESGKGKTKVRTIGYEPGRDERAYRLAGTAALPANARERIVAPDWVKALVAMKGWASFEAMPLAELRALRPFILPGSRYGLDGAIWTGTEIAATDGNQLQVVDIGQPAPAALDGLIYPLEVWGQPAVGVKKTKVYGGKGYVLSGGLARTVEDFPDYKQVIPARGGYEKATLVLLPHAARSLAAAFEGLSSSDGGLLEVSTTTEPFLRVKDTDGRIERKRVDLFQSISPNNQPFRCGFDPAKFLAALRAFPKNTTPRLSLFGSLSPAVFEEGRILHVLMPVRFD